MKERTATSLIKHAVGSFAIVTVILAGIPVYAYSMPGDLDENYCHVKKEVGVTTVPMSCRQFREVSYHSVHPCSKPSRPEVCDALDAYRAIDWEAPQDMINTGHRGLWAMEMPAEAMHDLNFNYWDAQYITDTPQNTLRAAHYSRKASISGIEYDLMLMRDDRRPEESTEDGYFGHYIDIYEYTNWIGPYTTDVTPGTGNSAGGTLYNMDPAVLEQYYSPLIVRDKYGLLPKPAVTSPNDVHFMGTRKYLENHFYRDMISGSNDDDLGNYDTKDLVLFIDLKVSEPLGRFYIKPNGDLGESDLAAHNYPIEHVTERSRSIKALLKSARALDDQYSMLRAQAGTVIKSGADVSADQLRDAIIAGGYQPEEIMVVPILNLRCTGYNSECTNEDRNRELNRLDRFAEVFGVQGLLYYEITFSSINHWSAKPFNRSVDGMNIYSKDLSDYIKQRYNLRSAFWFPTATGLPGSHQNWFETHYFYGSYPDWRHQGSRPSYQLGVMFYEPTYALGNMWWMTHAVCVNERPEVYLQVRNALIHSND